MTDSIQRRFAVQKDDNTFQYASWNGNNFQIYSRGMIGFQLINEKQTYSKKLDLNYGSIIKVQGNDRMIVARGDEAQIILILEDPFDILFQPKIINVTEQQGVWFYQLKGKLFPFQQNETIFVIMCISTSIYEGQLLIVNFSQQPYKTINAGYEQQIFFTSLLGDIISISVNHISIWNFDTFEQKKIIKNKYEANYGSYAHYQKQDFNYLVMTGTKGQISDQVKLLCVNLETEETDEIDSDISFNSLLSVSINLDALVYVDEQKILLFKFDASIRVFKQIKKINISNQDKFIAVEFLNSNQIWIQYVYYNYYITLNDCLLNQQYCQCDTTFLLSDTNLLLQQQIYGAGSNIPSSFTIVSKAILKINQCSQFLDDQSSQIKLMIDSDFINFNQQLLQSNYLQNVQLDIVGSTQSAIPIIYANNILKISNLKLVKFENLFIKFLNQNNECGLVFEKVQMAEINNVQFLSFQENVNCNKIIAIQSNLAVSNISINQQTFDDGQSIVTSIDSENVTFNNISIENCQFSKRFTIMQCKSETKLIINNLTLFNNQNVEAEDNYPLFEAHSMQINSIMIVQNSFSDQSLFSYNQKVGSSQLSFHFENVNVSENNLMFSKQDSFFTFKFISQEIQSAIITFNVAIFDSNNIIDKAAHDIQILSFIFISRGQKIQLNNVGFFNAQNIQLSQIEFAKEVDFFQVTCVNNDSYQIENTNYTPIFSFNEIETCIIDQLLIENKKVIDTNVVYFENQYQQNGELIIKNSQFKKIKLLQIEENKYTNTIMIQNRFSLYIEMNDCYFENIQLIAQQKTKYYSANALWVQSNDGQVDINRTHFINCQSNSKYNFVYVNIQTLQINQVEFDTTYLKGETLNIDQLYQNIGGFMNLKVVNLFIKDSFFANSWARYGSFLYIQPIGQQLFIDIFNSYFSNGFSSITGGAFFISSPESKINLKCDQCYFTNILSLGNRSSAIVIDSSYKEKASDYNEVVIQNGNLKNIVGDGESYFMQVDSANIKFENMVITTQLEELRKINYQNYIRQGIILTQSTLFLATNTNLNINQSLIDNYTFNPSSQPQFIASENSHIVLSKFIVTNSIFYKSGFKISGGSVQIINCSFKSIKQQGQSNLRLLEQNNTPINSFSLFIIQESQLTILDQTEFLNISCSQNCSGGALQILNTNFNIQQLQINSSKAQFGGGMFISGLIGQNYIKELNLEQNTADIDGGGIFIMSQQNEVFNLEISQSQINQNIASNGRGGGLFIKSNDPKDISKQQIKLVDTSILENKAISSGGIHQENIKFEIKGQTIIDKNIGQQYGNNICSQPTHLIYYKKQQKMLQQTNSSESKQNIHSAEYQTYQIVQQDKYIQINNFRSGGTLIDLSFQLATDNNDIVKPINDSEQQNFKIEISIPSNQNNINNYQLNGQTLIQYNKTMNAFVFSSLDIIGIPNSLLTLEVKSDLISTINPQNGQISQDYSFKVVIHFRECAIGEIKQTSRQITECVACEKGTYTFYQNNCKDCVEGATCNGGANLEIHSGYWRENNLTDIVLKCYNQEENCIGGSSGNQQCYEGHIGALCEECDIKGEYWDESFSRSSKYSCTKCSEIKYNMYIVVVLVLWSQISLSLAIKGGLEQMKEQAGVQLVQKNIKLKYHKKYLRFSLSSSRPPQNLLNELEEPISSPDEKSSVYIKMLTNYFQIIGTVSTFNLTIPNGIFETPQTIGQPLSQSMNSMECLLNQIDTDVPIIYLRFFFSLLIPIAYFILFILSFLIYHIIKKKKEFPYYIISSASMYLIILVQPDLVSQAIGLISCRKIGDRSYVLSNVSYECLTDEHINYIQILAPILFVWAILLPLILYLVLRKNKEKLGSFQIQLKYGFIYKEYSNRAYYWEFIKMTQKIIIMIILNFYSENISVKGTLVLMVITGYGILCQKVKPYQDEELNQVDSLSTNVCAVTVLLALLIQDNPYLYLTYSSLFIMIAINIWLLVKLTKSLISIFLIKFDPLIQMVIFLLVSKIKCLKQVYQKYSKKKSIKPEIRKKFQQIFFRFINQPIKIRRQIIYSIMEQKLILEHPRLFGGYGKEVEYLDFKDSCIIENGISQPLQNQINNENMNQDVINIHDTNENLIKTTKDQKQNEEQSKSPQQNLLIRLSDIEENKLNMQGDENNQIQQSCIINSAFNTPFHKNNLNHEIIAWTENSIQINHFQEETQDKNNQISKTIIEMGEKQQVVQDKNVKCDTNEEINLSDENRNNFIYTQDSKNAEVQFKNDN